MQGLLAGETSIVVTVTINDNDSEPTLTINPSVSVNESDGNASISTTLSNPSDSPVTFNYSRRPPDTALNN